MPLDGKSQLPFPKYAGANLAPLRPFLDLRENQLPSHYLNDAIKEIFVDKYKQDDKVWREIYRVGQMVAHFIEGKQFLMPDPFSGNGWRIIRPTREDDTTKRAMNIMEFYAGGLVAKWLASNPDVIVKPGKQDDKAIAAAKGADIVVEHYERKFNDAWHGIRECYLGLEFGTYINLIRYDSGILGAKAIREIVEEREEAMGPGSGTCECGYEGTADEFTNNPHAQMETERHAVETYESATQLAQMGANFSDEDIAGMIGDVASQTACPRCGSTAVWVEEAPKELVPIVTGTEEVQFGDLRRDILPLPGCRWNLYKRAEESNWFIYQEETDLGQIRKLLGNVTIPKGEGMDDVGLQIIKSLAFGGQAANGRSGGRDTALKDERVTHCEMWLEPECYAHIKLKDVTETVDGFDIPAGVSLAELFPKGLVAVGLNGFAVTTGLYGERLKDHLVSGVWQMKAMSGAGRGIVDTVEVQKRLNAFDSQTSAYFQASATPAYAYLEGAIDSDEVQYIGQPKANVPIKIQNLPENLRSLQQLVAPLAPGNMAAGFMEYTYGQLRTFAEMTSKVTEFSDAFSGVSNKTATGAQIGQATAQSLMNPPFSIKAMVRRKEAEIYCNLFKTHFPLKQSFMLGGSHGKQQAIWLSGADLDADLVFDVVRDSESPRTVFTKRQDYAEFFMLFGGAANYMALRTQAPAFVTAVERLWNIEMDASDDYDAIGQLCRKRLEQMKEFVSIGIQAADMMQLPDSPEVQAMVQQGAMQLPQLIQPPISVAEKSHRQKMEWFQDWLDTDEGQDAPLALRMGVESVIQIHFMFGGQQSVMDSMQAAQTQMAGMPPSQETGARAGK